MLECSQPLTGMFAAASAGAVGTPRGQCQRMLCAHTAFEAFGSLPRHVGRLRIPVLFPQIVGELQLSHESICVIGTQYAHTRGDHGAEERLGPDELVNADETARE